MEQSIGSANGLPIVVLLPVMLGFLGLLYPMLTSIKSTAGKLLVSALWLRFFMSALHTVTFQSSPVGLSWNALASIGVTAAGLLVIRRHNFLTLLFPVFALMLLVIASGLFAGDANRIFSVIVKYMYFVVLTLLTVDALQDIGLRQFSEKTLAPFCIPILLQLASLALGVSKGTEDGGGVSYIGGFSHESSFSIILLSALVLLCFTGYKSIVKAALLAIIVGGILLANYRTAILSVAPLLAVTLFTGCVRRFVPEQRNLVKLALLIIGGVATLGVVWAGEERFADLAVVARENVDIIKNPNDFTLEDRHLFSGRTMIWSRYLYGFSEGSPVQKLIGQGPESWGPIFGIYAHNTLVSTIFEYGYLGLALILLIWLWMLMLAVKGRIWMRSRLVAAHVSFVVLAMATMPMWLIEGLLFYALICGLSIYAYLERAKLRAASTRSSRHSLVLGNQPLGGTYNVPAQVDAARGALRSHTVIGPTGVADPGRA